MNQAATSNVLGVEAVPLLAKVLKGSKAPNPQAAAMLAQLVAWHRSGASLLDRNGDGKIDNPGEAIIDVAWPKLADAFMKPVVGPQLTQLDSLFGRFDAPARRSVQRLVSVLHPRHQQAAAHPPAAAVRQQLLRRTAACDNCQRSLWAALASAGQTLTRQQGTATPSAWHASATAIAIKFVPLNVFTMSYTNRPSGIQQAISFSGHRCA